MLLAVDVGNTHTVLGVFDGDRLVDHWRLATVAAHTADELALLVRGLLGPRPEAGRPTPYVVTGVSMCSVVPAVLRELRSMCARYFADVPVVVIEPGVRTGMPILIDNPKEVGADRIANALAARALVGGPAVVVDFGTSTNFDVISARGEYLGGAIAPGIEISVEALTSRGAQLRKVELVAPRSVIGKSTVEALQSGVVFGFAGQVDGILDRMVSELGGSATVIATGGLAPLVLSEARRLDRHEPWLTLIGLRLVFERNAAPAEATP
ncbi:MAG: type III pantothenate kinase [Actinomycetota bacterium]|nr:type III pantothenate kinase [Actinomycetota bacterium]